MSEIVIYKAKDGRVEIDVQLSNETVWLSLTQMAELFGRDKSVISRHLANIFKNKELEKNAVVANFATTAADSKTYQVDHYNLDAIISLGYRVNSKEGIRFRKWSSEVLKKYLIDGYVLRKKRLAEQGIKELQQSIALLQKTLVSNELVNDIGVETIQVIMSYAKTWHLLLAYDEDNLVLPEIGKPPLSSLDYQDAIKSIAALKNELNQKNEATALFGHEHDHGFQGILGNIEQTFAGEPLYKTAEERAANLLYFIIKDHPFSDGNKRIGCFIFLLYARRQNICIKLNDNGLVALALLIAESHPSQKELMVRLIVNLLVD